MTDKEDAVDTDTPPKKTWRDLSGALGTTEGPTDVAERHDYYIDKALREEYGIPEDPDEAQE